MKTTILVVVLVSIVQTSIAAAQVTPSTDPTVASVDYLDSAVVLASNKTKLGDFSLSAKGFHHRLSYPGCNGRATVSNRQTGGEQ
jgi:hypothetical protein